MPTLEDKAEVTNTESSFSVAEDEGLSAINVLVPTVKNKRIATRYMRDDIAVALCEITPFSFGKEIFIDFVKLNDITGRGISFFSTRQIAVNKKIILNLRFDSEMTFKINATIIYRSNVSLYQYGIKFDHDHRELSDHILDTQRTLIFK